MPLIPGVRLGPYEVIAAIGAGGMGEVYRATDTKLKRHVAIKILPPAVAADADRLARFQREAEVLASLNHPNIAGIYGLEEGSGVSALVMELVEGEDLSQRIARGPIPIEEALLIARQVAEALETAHEQGIIHRDLKPANIKVRADGTVKVLDFGLAKAMDRAGTSSTTSGDTANSPTITSPAPFGFGSGRPEQSRGAMTEMGMILGTAAYMAPEQAAGRPVDKRADIWSFGVVLWEMLVGRSLFASGETVSHVLADVLRAPIDFEAVPAGPLRQLVRRCLDRNVKTRLRDIGEARIVLAQPTVAEPATTAQPNTPTVTTWGLATALVVVSVVAAWSWLRPAPPPQQRSIVRFTDTAAVASVPGAVALARDGTRLAFVGPLGQIYVRSLDQSTPVPISKTDGARSLCFSPDGQWISYLVGATPATTQLMKVAVTGGPPQKLADAPRVGTATQIWTDDGSILFNAGGALARIASRGGPVVTLARPDEKNKEQYFSIRQLLPGGTNALLSVATGQPLAANRVVALNLESLEKKVLLEGVVTAHYVSSETESPGHLVFYDANSGSLNAVGFDLQRLELTGTPVPIVEGVRGVPGFFGTFSISASGSLAYVPGASATSPERTLVWVDRGGAEQPTGAPTRQYNLPRLSPDGERVAVEIQNASPGPVSVWVYDLVRTTLARLTTERSISPVWTTDGTRIIYADGGASVGLPNRLAVAPADRSGPPTTLAEETGMIPSSVSPDGQSVIGTRNRLAITESGDSSIIVVPLSGADAKPRLLLTSPFRKSNVVVSPDGRWIAYASEESGRAEVYVTAFPGPGATTPVSSDGGNNPRWSRDGRELFYRNAGTMMVVKTERTPTFRASRPESLFESTYGGYDVAPDGKRFLMIKNVAAASAGDADRLNIIVNWRDELKARVPTK